MSGNLRALRTKDVSPTIVVDSIVKELPVIKDIYVVAITEEDGVECPLVWASGNLANMAYAAMVFQDYSMRHIRGEIDEETYD